MKYLIFIFIVCVITVLLYFTGLDVQAEAVELVRVQPVCTEAITEIQKGNETEYYDQCVTALVNLLNQLNIQYE